MSKTDQLNVRVDPNIREALERVSLERQQPLSYVLRQLMMWFLHYYERAPDRASPRKRGSNAVEKSRRRPLGLRSERAMGPGSAIGRAAAAGP